MLPEIFWVFQKKKKLIHKEKCGTIKKLKSLKNVVIKKVSCESFSSMYKYRLVYDSFILELSISTGISTALLLWR